MNELFPNPLPFVSDLLGSVATSVSSGSGVDLLIKAVVAYLIVVWAAFVIWVVRDITNRSESLIIQTFSILLVVAFTPVFGVPIYLLIRPRTTIFERYYEEVGLAEGGTRMCDRCEREVGESYRYCPYCRNELLAACPECGELVEHDWEHCAFCGTNIEEAKKRKRDEAYRKASKPVPAKKLTASKKAPSEAGVPESSEPVGRELESSTDEAGALPGTSESPEPSKEPKTPDVTVGEVPEISLGKKK